MVRGDSPCHTEYPQLLRLETQKLEELLTSLDGTEEEGFAEALEAALLQRKAESLSDIDQSWDILQKEFLTEEGVGQRLFDGEDHSHASRLRPRWRRTVRRALLAAAAVLAVFAGIIAADAAGLELFSRLGHWTQSTFSFSAPTEPVASIDAALQETLQQLRMDGLSGAAFLLDGYQLRDISQVHSDTYARICFFYSDSQGNSYNFRAAVHSEPAQPATLYEKDGAGVEIYETNGKRYYLFSNLGRNVAAWSDGACELSLSGDLDWNTIKGLLDQLG